MLFSFLRDVPTESCETSKVSIFALQELIEEAWDNGVNDHGRIQTGGVRHTRKYVGTSEAQALFKNRGVNCAGTAFENTEGDLKAYEKLLDSIERYFHLGANSLQVTSAPKVTTTALPPVFLQRPGHSMTIVGLLVRRDGSRELLVFDPAYAPCKHMIDFTSAVDTFGYVPKLSKPYRRGKAYLEKFEAFETLRLTDFAPP
ncbi:zinc finger-containing ubiquitin peptidase 1, partial [Lecanoromycetidae sp. Uapishka_2]